MYFTCKYFLSRVILWRLFFLNMNYGNFFDGMNDMLREMTKTWNRGFKEKDGYAVIPQKDGKGYILVFNTIGINPDDIKVVHSTVEDYLKSKGYHNNDVDKTGTYLRVAGATKIPELDDQLYTTDIELLIRNTRPVEKVQYEVKNGLTIVYLKLKDAEEFGTTGSKIANGGTFDW